MNLEVADHSVISFSENGRKVEIDNSKRDKFYFAKLDLCSKSNDRSSEGSRNLAADFFCKKNQERRFLLVELKGANVHHGIKQIISSAEFCSDKLNCHIASGIIASRSHPKIDSTIQKLKKEFKKKFKGPVHVVCGNYRFQYDALHQFGDPRRILA